MKHLILAASLLLSILSATPALAQAAQETPSCHLISDTEARSRAAGAVVEKVRAFTGADYDKLGPVVDNSVPQDLDIDDSDTLLVYRVNYQGEETIALVFTHDGCLDAMVRVDWDRYQDLLTAAFGPRA